MPVRVSATSVYLSGPVTHRRRISVSASLLPESMRLGLMTVGGPSYAVPRGQTRRPGQGGRGLNRSAKLSRRFRRPR
jgi:hypothetical protein